MWPFTSVWGQLLKLAAIATTVLGLIVGLYRKGRKAGVEAEKTKLRTATNKLQDQFNAIDRRPDSFDDAISSLHRRADRD